MHEASTQMICGFGEGAGGGIRTHKPVRAAVFETAAYTVPPRRRSIRSFRSTSSATDAGGSTTRLLVYRSCACPARGAVRRAIDARGVSKPYYRRCYISRKAGTAGHWSDAHHDRSYILPRSSRSWCAASSRQSEPRLILFLYTRPSPLYRRTHPGKLKSRVNRAAGVSIAYL